MDKIAKIRKLLGDEYHLSIECYCNCQIKKWNLYRKYKNLNYYFSSNNKPIMTGNKTDIDKLYKFAKEHHKINENRAIGMTNIIITFIAVIIAFINVVFFNNEFFRGLVYGIDMVVLINAFVNNKVRDKNYKVELLKIKESNEDCKEDIT